MKYEKRFLASSLLLGFAVLTLALPKAVFAQNITPQIASSQISAFTQTPPSLIELAMVENECKALAAAVASKILSVSDGNTVALTTCGLLPSVVVTRASLSGS